MTEVNPQVGRLVGIVDEPSAHHLIANERVSKCPKVRPGDYKSPQVSGALPLSSGCCATKNSLTAIFIG